MFFLGNRKEMFCAANKYRTNLNVFLLRYCSLPKERQMQDGHGESSLGSSLYLNHNNMLPTSANQMC